MTIDDNNPSTPRNGLKSRDKFNAGAIEGSNKSPLGWMGLDAGVGTKNGRVSDSRRSMFVVVVMCLGTFGASDMDRCGLFSI